MDPKQQPNATKQPLSKNCVVNLYEGLIYFTRPSSFAKLLPIASR